MAKGTREMIARRTPEAECVEARTDACAPEAFLLFLRRERSRVDRQGGELGLVLWDLGQKSRDRSFCRTVTGCIRAAMRSIDTLGWVNSCTLGVLLPATGREGAVTFGRRASEAMVRRTLPPPWTAFSYPQSIDESVRALWEEGSNAPGAPHGKDGSAALFSRIFLKPLPAWKRILDVTGSLFGLLVLSPVLALIALYIKAVSPGPVLFRQKRVGRGGVTFLFLKFRTMEQGNDDSVHREHLRQLIHGGARPMEKLDAASDRRIIRGGGILRKTSLDELPQLLNVVRGEMSLVGPRPCIPYEAREYLRWHAGRFDVPPGMTGLWQVSGKNRLSFEEMIRLDIAYSRKISLLRDLAILLRTGPTVVGLALEAFFARRDETRPSAATGDGSLSHG